LHSKEAAGKAAMQEHPSWAVTAEPTKPPASFQCNPEGWKRLGRFSALLARARPLRVLPLRSRLEKRPNRFQQMPFPFNQWFPKSLLKYWGMSREAILGHMARRERRASPLWGCKERATPPDGPRWPRPEGCAAFWAVLRCSSVADPRGVCSLVAPCNSPKIDATRHTPIFQQALSSLLK